MRRIELPRDTRTTFAENDGLALFCAFPGGLPPTLGEGGDSPGQLGDSGSLGMPDLSREGCRHLEQRRGAPGAGRASRGGVTRFVGDRAGDSIRFARAEAEKMPSLKIPAAQSVGHAQSWETDQQVSIRMSCSGAIWDASRCRNRSPRSRIRIRW